MDGKPQPVEAIESVLCEAFGCTLRQLDEEDTPRLMAVLYARNVADAFQALKSRRTRSPAQRALIGGVLREKAARDHTHG